MRTTIDIPDKLFRQIKATVAMRGETLKSFLLRAAKSELDAAHLTPKKRAKLPIVRSNEKSYDLSPTRLATFMEEEDRELVAGH